jgi:hypothetical protein
MFELRNIVARSGSICTASAVDTNWHRFSRRGRLYGDFLSYSCPILFKFLVSRRIIIKVLNIKFHGTPVSGNHADTREQTDCRNGVTKLIGAFRYYAHAPENRVLAHGIESHFLGRPFCNLVFILSSFGSWFSRFKECFFTPQRDFCRCGQTASRRSRCSVLRGRLSSLYVLWEGTRS